MCVCVCAAARWISATRALIYNRAGDSVPGQKEKREHAHARGTIKSTGGLWPLYVNLSRDRRGRKRAVAAVAAAAAATSSFIPWRFLGPRFGRRSERRNATGGMSDFTSIYLGSCEVFFARYKEGWKGFSFFVCLAFIDSRETDIVAESAQ